MAGCTLVGGFGLGGPCLVESLLYLGPWDEHRCACFFLFKSCIHLFK